MSTLALSWIAIAIAGLALVVALGLLATMWRRLALVADRMLALEGAWREFQWDHRAVRHGTATFEVEQRGKLHEIRNWVTHHEVRLEEVEKRLGIVSLPPDATGEAPAVLEPDDTPKEPQ